MTEFANHETLGLHEGKPLLDQEGMDELRGLLDAHIGFEEAGNINAEEISEIDAQIAALESKKQRLVKEKDDESSKQHSARHSHQYGVRNAVEKPSRSTNPVYAAVLRSIESDGQGKLWYPQTLAVADKTGRSFVELDKELSHTPKSQSIMLVEQYDSGWAHLYIAKTKPITGLKPTKIAKEHAHGLYSTRTVEHDALRLPVKDKTIKAFQIHPKSFGKQASILDYKHDKPGLRSNKSMFSLILPRGTQWRTQRLARYVSGHGIKTVEGSLGESFMDRTRTQFAIGDMAVMQTIDELSEQFTDRDGSSEARNLMFAQLARLAPKKQPAALAA